MKTLQLIKKLSAILVVTATLVAAFSCNKNLSQSSIAQVQESKVIFAVTTNGTTKATGENYEVAANYNSINTLEFFVFNTEGGVAGSLDSYKKFTDIDELTKFEVKATTGDKQIYAVANSHIVDWNGVSSLEEFKEQVSKLSAEDLKDFTMVNSIEATLQAETTPTLAINLERLVAKIELASIKTTFTGTPYEGMKLENVKAYLTNVHSSKFLHDNTITVPVILNSKKNIDADVKSCKDGVLYDAISAQIGDYNADTEKDASYNTSHYFFAYENKLVAETADNRFTRLVIQADLDGITYYYPININQEGYGYVAENGHKGIQRNTEYTINVSIHRPGSLDPDKPMEYGVLTATVTVAPWRTTTVANTEF